MQKTILIEILAALSEKERVQFKNYVYSPFFNKNEKVRQLCSHVLRYAPSFQHSYLEKPYVYQLLFQDDNYREVRLNNVISDLLQLLYGYLTYVQQQSTPMQQYITLLEALLKRNLQRPIPRVVRRVEQLRQKEAHQSIDFYRAESLLYEQLNYYAFTQSKLNKLSYDENLQYTSDRLDVYYWSHKLRNACEMVNRSAVLGGKYSSDFLDDFLAFYKQYPEKYTAYPALQIFHQTYLFLETPDEGKYHALRKLLTEHQALLPPDEVRNIYTYMLNYCIRQVNFGQIAYYKEMVAIYQALDEQNLLLQQGYLTKWSFMNATTAGMRIGEYAWTEQFIKKHQGELLEAERQNTVDYQLAALYFAKGEHEKTLEFLHQVEFTDIFYHASAKLILLKVYYELDEVEAFYPLVNATKSLLRRSRELSDYHRSNYVNFLKLVKKLYDLKISPKSNVASKLAQLGEQLAATSPLANKGWLLEQHKLLTK